MKTIFNDLTCRVGTTEDFPEIDMLRLEYYSNMNKQEIVDNMARTWGVCVDGLGVIQGCYSYTIIEGNLLLLDFYVKTPIAITRMEEDIEILARYIKVKEVIFAVDAANTKWTTSLEKHGYKANTIIYRKEII